ncbi:MAG: hypothetical protein J5I93_16955 [Pirellulaceae bacterium]|nr:hypothetical protein [Pirellulaceae bacterium]
MICDERLKSLPVPTPEQTARFADHVADNHSWCKHLPFFPPGASFVFFPNPHAGRGVKAEGERFKVYDIKRGDYFPHHSRLATAEYLAQFGHWDYWVDDNPRVLDPQPGPWLYAADGSHRELLPDDLKGQWSCRLTAFLNAAPPMLGLRPSELRREADAFLAAGRRTLSRIVLGLFDSQGNEDPAFERYRALVRELSQATASSGNASLDDFMESERRAQRELLLATLQQVRAAWANGPT